ncbi:hypothetical protein BDN70DRAFT_174159 [Pholiota conissans]|uniref:Uncharacterized protein n=1 Tax=Pholiota conissans TaxID=109636 RepID=A0A9P5YV98_9AGAR|nr:hypothetical protein BDN70DRAFT_174159 [Pholiota conissans]
MPIPDVAFITTLTIIFLYAALLPLTNAECPTCPCTIEPIFKLTNQTNGNCRYEAPRRRFVFECVYWENSMLPVHRPQINRLSRFHPPPHFAQYKFYSAKLVVHFTRWEEFTIE